MNPEKEIINWWLNKKGFFTITSVPASKNKEVGILAIKQEAGKVSKIIHIETSCSISAADNLAPEEVENKFKDKLVVRTVKKCIKEYIGKELGYERCLVLGLTSRLDDYKKLRDIEVLEFEQILFEVFSDLDKQNYRNQVIRTLQLLKYILLASPSSLAKLIEKQDKNKILKQNTRERFIKTLLQQEETKRILEKESNEAVLKSILKNSSLNKPEKLAKVLIEEVLSTRSRKRFLKTLLEHVTMKKIKEKLLPKKEKPLSYFFKRIER